MFMTWEVGVSGKQAEEQDLCVCVCCGQALWSMCRQVLQEGARFLWAFAMECGTVKKTAEAGLTCDLLPTSLFILLCGKLAG